MIALPDVFFTSLEVNGWAMSDGVIPHDWRLSLRGASQTLWEAGQFHDATIGKHASRQNNPKIRGDSICWVDFNTSPFNTHPFTGFLAELRQTLNQQYYLGLRSEEFHLARYDSGYGYSRHLDQHRNSPHRKISAVLYLNDDWNAEDGGELCLYETTPDAEVQHDDTAQATLETQAQTTKTGTPLERVTKLLPLPGRLVVFRSDTIWHEVLPTRRTRWSLTGWFRDDDVF